MTTKDRFTACLLGGAAGDALGYAVEFMYEYAIDARYGEGGIKEYDLTGGQAIISDDTQMTLFTAEGLITAAHGDRDWISAIRESYKLWYITQRRPYSPEYAETGSLLMTERELFSPRAPGNTCMSSIAAGATGSVEDPINHSKGCGGVMRVAPVGLFFASTDTPLAASDMLAAEAAALTHGHEMGYIPAAAQAHIVRLAAEGETSLRDAVKDAVSAMNELFPAAEHMQEFTELMNTAIQLSESDENDRDAIHRLGEGWVGDEALAIAVYCALKHENDFDAAIRAAVNHNGDSDSTGAVAGNILGAYLGMSGIPDKYLDRLELRRCITQTAETLFDSRA